ncbi:MAG: PQQ-dependent sugar dehydrogenase [Nitrosomonas sp.]|nr:PQQ-dependent sugar dehydrogenase [Nitrosomonas sp.]
MKYTWLFFYCLLLQALTFHVYAQTASLPLEKINLPPGFTISVWAQAADARTMTLGDNGTVFVGSRSAGKVYAVTQNNGERRVRVIADKLKEPTGVTFLDGALYVSAPGHVLRFSDIEQNLESPTDPEQIPVTLFDKNKHGPGYFAAGPDGRLYLSVIAPCNVCETAPDQFALIASMLPDGSNLEIFARGVRHSVGFDWHPISKTLWFSDISRNWMGDNLPPDELNHAPQKAMHFGFPYCHGSIVLDPKFGAKRGCEKFTAPALDLDPHVRPMGVRFYTGNLFPEQYHQQIFVAEYGSWNRREKTGYQIESLQIKDGQAINKQIFASGWLSQDNEAWGRPVDLLIMPDGAMLVSDDLAGVIYRIDYHKPQ